MQPVRCCQFGSFAAREWAARFENILRLVFANALRLVLRKQPRPKNIPRDYVFSPAVAQRAERYAVRGTNLSI